MIGLQGNLLSKIWRVVRYLSINDAEMGNAYKKRSMEKYRYIAKITTCSRFMLITNTSIWILRLFNRGCDTVRNKTWNSCDTGIFNKLQQNEMQ